ncbi:MAG: amidohydrolase family protein, partial [Acidobacteriota bacterium]|nr:amidohydrolase family protein [Acidobacteriota bacterium]
PVADNKTPAAALAYTEKYLARFRGDPLVVAAVAPHALYTNSDETLQASRALANRFHAPLVIHLSETKKENDDEIAKRGTTPAKTLDNLGVWNGRSVAAHAVWVTADDMRILKARSVGIAHCPSSNMKLASGVAPVTRMLALGLAVGLGPDGPAGSNNDFNLFEEMDLAAKLQKVTTLDPQALPAGQALEMATIGGARALGMEREIGSLEAGKKADLITVRIDRPNAQPIYDAVSQMVYALKASDVRDVMVNGRPVVRDARCLTLNQPQILAKAAEYQAKVTASLK